MNPIKATLANLFMGYDFFLCMPIPRPQGDKFRTTKSTLKP